LLLFCSIFVLFLFYFTSIVFGVHSFAVFAPISQTGGTDRQYTILEEGFPNFVLHSGKVFAEELYISFVALVPPCSAKGMDAAGTGT
jgi:hypothetical protein